MLPPTALGCSRSRPFPRGALALARVLAAIPVESHQNRRLQRGPRALHYAVGGQKAATLLPAAVRHKGV